jgi:lactoylglutathione lyase
MAESEFLHVGLTVRDMNKTIEFYTKYFNFSVEMKGVFSEEFISGHNQLYKLKEGVFSDFCFLKAPNGIVLEVFQFSEEVQGELKWNCPGYHHICLKVKDVCEVYENMRAEGIEFFFAPDVRDTPDKHWVFLKDPDGNLIELQD